jgi:YidC/Oxa1 family membrane protein insertase
MNLRPLIFVLCTTASFFVISHFTSVKSLSYKLESHQAKPQSAPVADSKSERLVKKPLNLAKNTKRLALENSTLQLIFSPKSASITEINLPLETLSNASVIHQTEVDKKAASIPSISRFPLLPSLLHTGQFIPAKTGGYYPLTRRGDIEVPAETSHHGLRLFVEGQEITFEPVSHTENQIAFYAEVGKSGITKTYSLHPEAPYSFDVSIETTGPKLDLYLAIGGLEAEPISKKVSPTLSYKTVDGDKTHIETLKLPKLSENTPLTHADWISCSNGFFGMVLRPKEPFKKSLKLFKVEKDQLSSRLLAIDPKQQEVSGDLSAYFMAVPVELKNNKADYHLYTGPFHKDILNYIDKVAEKSEGQDPEVKSASSFFGFFSFITEPFSRLLLVLINFFYSLTGSWGLSIILLTIALKVMLYPLSGWAIRSNIKVKNLGPELALIKQRYAKDPKRANLEQIRLYKERKVNPLAGCFIQFLQLPFLFGMFDLLKTTFQLRGASFIPGWINDLAAPDVLFSWGYSLPLIGNEFHLLPILNALGMLVQQKLMTKLPKDPSQWTDQQRQQKVMGNVLVVFIAFIFYNMPSGLNLYFIFSMLLTALQQWLTEKSMNKKTA